MKQMMGLLMLVLLVSAVPVMAQPVVPQGPVVPGNPGLIAPFISALQIMPGVFIGNTVIGLTLFPLGLPTLLPPPVGPICITGACMLQTKALPVQGIAQ